MACWCAAVSGRQSMPWMQILQPRTELQSINLGACRTQVFDSETMGGRAQISPILTRISGIRKEKSVKYGSLSHRCSRIILSLAGPQPFGTLRSTRCDLARPSFGNALRQFPESTADGRCDWRLVQLSAHSVGSSLNWALIHFRNHSTSKDASPGFA